MIRAALRFLVLVAFAAGASAHPGHGAAISQDEAVQRATSEIGRLVSVSKLEKSWKLEAKLETVRIHTNGDSQEWALTFSNARASDAQQRTLYVFLSDTGAYLAANFSGR